MTSHEHDDDPRLDALLRAVLRAPTPGPRAGRAAAANDDGEDAGALSAAPAGGPLSGADLDTLFDPDELDDGVLALWRAGRLDADQTAAVDARLATDAEARGRALAWAQDAPNEGHFAAAERAALAGRGRRFTQWLALAAAALLAGLGGWWVSQRSGAEAPPAYTSGGLQGGMAQVRGDDPPGDAAPVYLADGRLEVHLRPATRQAKAPGVLVLVASTPPPTPDAVAAAGPLRLATAASVEVAEGGAVTVRAPAGPLVGNRPGHYTLHLALGPATVEKVVGLSPAEARAAHPGVAWFEHPFELIPTPPDHEVPP